MRVADMAPAIQCGVCGEYDAHSPRRTSGISSRHSRCVAPGYPELKRAYRRSTGSHCNFEGSYAILAIWPHT